LDVSIIIDSSNSFQSTNNLTINFVNSPNINTITDTGIFLTLNSSRALLYSPNSQRIATITGSGFQNSPNNKVYAYFKDGKVFEINATSDTEIQIPLPIVDPGKTIDTVYISIDKNYYSPVTLTNPINIESCPNGSYCGEITITSCPVGKFCPDNQIGKPLVCGPGYLQTNTGAQSCDLCSNGTDSKFCPYSSGIQVNCPAGFLWNNKTDRIEADFTIWPEGLVWDSSTTSYDISGGIGLVGVPGACPNGKWCGKGVSSIDHISGDMSTPQICSDGVVCGQNIDWTTSTVKKGSKDSSGSYSCPITQYCTDGGFNICPEGMICPQEGLRNAEYCPAGFYSKAGKSEWSKCEIGTFCPFLGTSNPVQCSPGSVCQLNSQLGITQLCPAGSYWISKTVTSRSNYTLFDSAYIPIYCNPGTYCLTGVYNPVIDLSNPQAAQNCIEGSYCPEGTASPSGISCPPGYYWPKNSQTPIPTDPGYFASNFGNVRQEPWPPGTFSNQSAVSSCTICPAGYEWILEATVVPSLCKIGTYKPLNENLIYCGLCPQGTWSNQTGLVSVSECTLCEPRIACILEGMTSLTQAIDCPEGYVCSNYGTTSFTMFSIPCPEGYYWGTRTAVPADYNFCDRGLYCPSASTSTGRTQNKCLTGYFCPLGTAATLNSLGTFDAVFQLAEARALEGTPSYPPCSEDATLPATLIDQYINGGVELRCPPGTTSPRGAWCIGQWIISSTTIVETFNPVNGSWTVDGEVNVVGENTNFTGRNLVDPLNIPLYEYTISKI